ncbi:MAG: T9SS type A sorting domain-containing protein [Fidelibacterota bacterium]
MLNKPLYIVLTIVLLFIHISAQQWEFTGLQNENVSTIVIDPSDDLRVYAGSLSNFSDGTWGKIFKSIDGGSTWDTLLYGVSVNQIVIHPNDSNILYATLGAANNSPSGIIKTVDGGNSWAQADSGIDVDWETDVLPLAIDPHHPDTLFAGTVGFFGGTLYKSIDGGQFWYDIGEQISDNNIHEIVIDHSNSQIVYVGTFGIGKIFKSYDGGDNWEVISPWFEPGGVTALAIDPEESDRIYAGLSQFGFFLSNDGGSTWVEIDSSLTADNFTSIVISPTNHEEIYLSTWDGGVFKSSDAGSSWVVLNSGLSSLAVNSMVISASGGQLYCSLWEGGIYRSSSSILIKGFEFIPNEFKLYQNYPNPFNDVTTLKYHIPKAGIVALEILDVKGRTTRTLVDYLYQTPGDYKVLWNGKDAFGANVSSGVYIMKITNKSSVRTKKLIFLK